MIKNEGVFRENILRTLFSSTKIVRFLYTLCMHRLFLGAFLLMCSCARHDGDYFLKEGREIQEKLISIIENVETVQELQVEKKRLQRCFTELVDVMIEARAYQKKTNSSWHMSKEDERVSKELEKELNRLYGIPGAKEFIEKCYEEPLLRLTKES